MAIKHSPLIAQYLNVKQKVPDAILFFRLGDFYEMMFEDAEVGARVLDIQLTSRSKDGVPLCGVPYHSAEPYIAKLLKAGLKVAICEQTQPQSQPRSRLTLASAGNSPGSEEPFQLTSPRGLIPAFTNVFKAAICAAKLPFIFVPREAHRFTVCGLATLIERAGIGPML